MSPSSSWRPHVPFPGLSILVLISGLAAPRLLGQVARTEIHPFASTTASDQEFLAGGGQGKLVTLAGELRIPKPGSDRLPAIVLLHGSSGISGYVSDWEQELNALGVATFVVDSFTARGIVNTNFDQEQLGRLAMIVDAYRALDLLSRHPRIDPTRIALMGFSRGGQAALYASLRRFHRLHGSPGREFAAYLVFYPSCGTTYKEELDVARKPIRVFHGATDDYNPVEPCSAYAARLKAAGSDVQLMEYAGAAHAFDARAVKAPTVLAKAQTTRACRLSESEGGVIVNAATGKPFTYTDPCVELGPTVGYNEVAATEARRAVREFVLGTLKP
jgi:dienelactone hydrolase